MNTKQGILQPRRLVKEKYQVLKKKEQVFSYKHGYDQLKGLQRNIILALKCDSREHLLVCSFFSKSSIQIYNILSGPHLVHFPELC